MEEDLDIKALRRRVHKVIGQCTGVDRMLARLSADDKVKSKNIIVQVSAAKNALHEVGQLLLEHYLLKRMQEVAETGVAPKTLDQDFVDTLKFFSRMRK